MIKRNTFLLLASILLSSAIAKPVKARNVDFATSIGIYATAATMIYGGFYWATKKPRKNDEENCIERIARTSSGVILFAAGCSLAMYNKTIQKQDYLKTLSDLYRTLSSLAINH